MATPSSDKMEYYFASKYLIADGGTIAQRTADAGGSTTTIVDAGLTDADDYWNGALLWFDGNTTTAALQGQFAHVSDWVNSTNTLTLAKALPAAPVAGDTFRLILGGNWRGDTECYGLEADAKLPELTTVTGTNITGLTLKYLSGLLGEGTLSIFYDQSEDTLQLKMGSDPYGATLDVSGDVTGGVLYGDDGQQFAIVDVVNASLPGTDQTDTFATTVRKGVFVPDFEAYETDAGKTRYRLLVIKNGDGVDTMVNVRAWCGKPVGDDTATTTTATIAAGTVTLADASTHPATSYWIYNSTKNDLRFVKFRTGNVCSFTDATGGLRGKTAQAWDIADTIEVYPDFDIGLDAPSTLQFENPTDEETAPSGVTFSAPTDSSSGLVIGDMTAGGIYGIWFREALEADARGRDDLVFDVYTRWS